MRSLDAVRVDHDRFLYASILAIALAVVPIVAMSDMVNFDRVAIPRLVLCAALFGAALAALALMRAGRRRLAALLLVAALWGGATVFAFYTGIGVHSAVVFVYLPALLYTSILLGMRAAAVQAALTVAALFAMVWAENHGVIAGLPAFFEKTTNFNFALGAAVSCVGCLIIAVAWQRSVDEAVRALEHSRRELARAHAEVSDANRALEARVAERTRDLAHKLEELESFNYTVAHDLRAPLRAINAHASRLEPAEPATRLALERIAAETLHMDRLLIALLDLAQLGRRPVSRRATDLSFAAERVAASLAAQDGAVRFRIQPGLVAQGDADLLRALLGNLLGNAFKFSRGRPDPQVEFGRRPSAEGGAYFVRDNGVGFDPTHAGQLFRPFHRLHESAAYPGIGVGLASAQRIVRLHHGSIWAEGATDGGATFYFTLGEA